MADSFSSSSVHSSSSPSSVDVGVALEATEVDGDVTVAVSSMVQSESSSSEVSVGEVAGAVALAVEAGSELTSVGASEPSPVKLASTPAACMRAMASDVVSQERLVPSLLTNGRATQTVPPEHGVNIHFCPTHCANAFWTQAWSPSVHASVLCKVANCALSFCASRALDFWKFVGALCAGRSRVAIASRVVENVNESIVVV